MGERKRYPYHGEMLTMQEIAEASGVSIGTIYVRLHRGWTLEDAASMPVQDDKPYPYHGEMLTVGEISKRSGASPMTIARRVHCKHMTVEEAADYVRPSRAKRFAYKGEMLTYQQVSERSGVPVSTLKRRMIEYGISIEEAAECENPVWAPKYIYKGKAMTLGRIAQATGISRNTLSSRLHQGWTLEQATETPVAPKKREEESSETPPGADALPPEQAQMIAVQKIARTVATPDLRKWRLRQVAPGRYAFSGYTIDWTIRFLPGDRAELTAQVRKCVRSSGFRRVFDVSGGTVREIVPDWWP